MSGTTLRTAGLEQWPALPLENWKDTCDTLHMWTQIVGKIRLEFTPYLNHWWNSTLYVNSRGLTTSAMSYGPAWFEIQFDFIDHRLIIETSKGLRKTLGLYARSVADFYCEVLVALQSLGIEAKINHMPVEVPDPVPFDQDHIHASYDAEAVNRFWHILMPVAEVMNVFRGRFVGKSSPVHFFWGSFDLAVTRFSGKRAPARKDADAITREAYSHECISAGFWPGGGDVTGPAFYSYTAPAPAGIERETVRPERAFYSPQMGEFMLMYDDLRANASPREALLEFFESTYEVGANLAHWDRAALERRESDGGMHAPGSNQSHAAG